MRLISAALGCIVAFAACAKSGNSNSTATGPTSPTTPTPTYTIGGTLSALASGVQIALQNNGGNTLTLSANGSFSFSTAVASNASYVVTVSAQPPGQVCTVANGSGSAVTANVSNITVTCAAVVAPPNIASNSNAILAWYSDDMDAIFDDATLHAYLDHIKSVGYSGVTLQFVVDCDSAGNVLAPRQFTRAFSAIDYAKSNGLNTGVQIIWSTANNTPIDGWSAPTTFSVPALIQGANGALTALATTAQAHGVKSFSLGIHSDFLFAAAYHAQWSTIIANIRAAFSGTISHSAWESPFGPDVGTAVGIWDLVDQIGVEYTLPISATPVSDPATIEAAFFAAPTAQFAAIGAQTGYGNITLPYSNLVTTLTALSTKYGKPLILENIHFFNITSALNGGFDPTQSQQSTTPYALDPSLQTAGYQATLDIVTKNLATHVGAIDFGLYEPWMYGTFTGSFAPLNSWKYYGSLAGPTTDFPGTPAEAEISSYLGKKTSSAARKR